MLAGTLWIGLIGPNVLRAEEGAPGGGTADPFAGVEEVWVWGIRTGQLPDVPSASTDRLLVDDFTARPADEFVERFVAGLRGARR